MGGSEQAKWEIGREAMSTCVIRKNYIVNSRIILFIIIKHKISFLSIIVLTQVALLRHKSHVSSRRPDSLDLTVPGGRSHGPTGTHSRPPCHPREPDAFHHAACDGCDCAASCGCAGASVRAAAPTQGGRAIGRHRRRQNGSFTSARRIAARRRRGCLRRLDAGLPGTRHRHRQGVAGRAGRAAASLDRHRCAGRRRLLCCTLPPWRDDRD